MDMIKFSDSTESISSPVLILGKEGYINSVPQDFQNLHETESLPQTSHKFDAEQKPSLLYFEH